jgi:hypothetical protein
MKLSVTQKYPISLYILRGFNKMYDNIFLRETLSILKLISHNLVHPL